MIFEFQRVAISDDDADSDTSGSIIVTNRRNRGGLARIETSDSYNSDDMDDGMFEGSNMQWEDDDDDTDDNNQRSTDNNRVSGEVAVTQPTAAPKDTGIDSDTSLTDDDGQSDKCPICLASFRHQEIATPETCNHQFCAECLQEWSKNMNTCPVDRHQYSLILVRKTPGGNVIRQIAVQPPNPNNPDNDGGEPGIVDDPTFCEICGSSAHEDRMLLCDGCDLGFHLECLNPPLNDVPTGAWYCADCSLLDTVLGSYEMQLLLGDAATVLTARILAATNESNGRRRRNNRPISSSSSSLSR